MKSILIGGANEKESEANESELKKRLLSEMLRQRHSIVFWSTNAMYTDLTTTFMHETRTITKKCQISHPQIQLRSEIYRTALAAIHKSENKFGLHKSENLFETYAQVRAKP